MNMLVPIVKFIVLCVYLGMLSYVISKRNIWCKTNGKDACVIVEKFSGFRVLKLL